MAKIKLDIEANFDALRRAGSHVQELSREAGQLNQTMNNGFRQSASAVDNFDSTIRRANTDLERMERQTRGTSNALGTASNQAESFGSKISSMATGFVAGAVITGGLAAIGGAFKHAIDLQKEFEKSIQNLSAITGASGADLDFYKDKALQLGTTVKGGAVAVVEAFKLIGSAKPELLSNKEALAEVTEQAILLSHAAGLELPDAATRLTDAMNQFGASSDQAGMFVDTLAAAAKFGAAEVPEVTEALLKFGVAAKSSNITVQESAAAIELLAEKGLKGSEAGTALRNVFLKLSTAKALPKEALDQLKKAGVDTNILSDNSKTLEERLKELSKIQNNSIALSKVFGTENLVAGQAILQNTDRLKELTLQIGKEGFGSAAEQAAKNMDTLDQALLETGNQYDNLLLSITSGDFGNLIKGFVKSANDELKKLASQISDVGTLFTQGFGGLQDKKFAETAKELASQLGKSGGQVDLLLEKEKQLKELRAKSNDTKEVEKLNLLLEENAKAIEKTGKASRIATAQKLADQIKVTNSLLQSGDLTDKQRAKFSEELKQKAVLVNAILAVDKKQAIASTEIAKEALVAETTATSDELNKRKKLHEDFQKALLDLQKRVRAAQLEQAAPAEKIELERKFAQEELDLYQAQFEKVGQLADKNFKLSLEQQQQFEYLRNAINLKAAEAQIKIEVDKQNKIAQARLANSKLTGDNLNLEEQNAISNVQLSGKPSDISEVDFETLKQKKIFEIQQEYALKKLELKKETLANEREVAVKAANGELALLEGKEDAESKMKRDQILKNLELTEKKFAAEGEATQNATAKIINDLQNQIDGIDKKTKKFSLASMLGITEDDLRNLQSAIGDVGEIFNSFLDIQLSKNEKIIESSQEKQAQIDSEISDLESQLNTEQEIGQRGLANNFDKVKAEIELKQAAKAKEKEIELKAIEDRKALQKQKLALDTVLQASNLFVAATEIYAKAAASSGPLSVPIAIAAIGAMLAAFVTQKALALQAINEGQGFAKGKIGIEGPGTETSDSIQANLSRGESVITAKVTKKRRSLLEALASDKDAVVTRALIEELQGTGVTLDRNLPRELSAKKSSIKDIELMLVSKADNSKMEKELVEMRKTLYQMNAENKKKIYTDQNGNLVKKFGSHTSVTRKK